MASEIRDMVLGFLHSIGVEATDDGRGVFRARIPAGEQPFFNDQEVFTFTFDRELAQNFREAEFIGEGSFFLRRLLERMSATPKVCRVFRAGEPEAIATPATGRAHGEPAGGGLRVVQPGAPFYRQRVIFSFRITFDGHVRTDQLFAVSADAMTDQLEILDELPTFAGCSEQADPALEIRDQTEDLLRAYLRALALLEAKITPTIAQMQEQSRTAMQGELDRINRYFDEQRRELQQKKENVYFHLYFFQKEEEIDRLLTELESERKRKLQEIEEKNAMRIDVTLIGAVVECIPTRSLMSAPVARKGTLKVARATIPQRTSAAAPPQAAI